LLQRLQGDWCCVAWNAPDSVAPNQLCGWLGQEHGGSIPLADKQTIVSACPLSAITGREQKQQERRQCAVIRSPRRRWQAAWMERSGQALWRSYVDHQHQT
jgi:hypothetical protein